MSLRYERIERLQELVTSAQTTSLETPVGEEGETEMIDLIQDENQESPQDHIASFLQHERIEALLLKMNERERRVLTLRYGLDDGVSRTLGETAKFFNITRERVRQIEVVAIKKFRALLATEAGDNNIYPAAISPTANKTGSSQPSAAARPAAPAPTAPKTRARRTRSRR